jgi:hypothetical protein
MFLDLRRQARRPLKATYFELGISDGEAGADFMPPDLDDRSYLAGYVAGRARRAARSKTARPTVRDMLRTIRMLAQMRVRGKP